MNKIVSSLSLICIYFQLNAQSIPELKYSQILINPDEMDYNPTGEFASPCVIRATDYLVDPLGEYYLYYAPADESGGICLAYSDDISGPYIEYENNPIITTNHQGKYDFSNVSSPHVLWMEQYNKYLMYFQGDKTTILWGYSENGVTWNVANEHTALDISTWGSEMSSEFTECFSAKVFENTSPGINDPYFMIMTLTEKGRGSKIGLASSEDGKKFFPLDQALVAPNSEEGENISGPFYWANEGKHYIIYNTSTGKLNYTEIGADFDLENHLGVFFSDTAGPGKAADCYLFYEDNRWNMFYSLGEELSQTIAYATGDLPTDINKDKNREGFLCYPNPASEKINVISTGRNINEISITNLQGQVVFRSRHQEYVDLTSIGSGIYIMLAEFSDGSEAKSKFVRK